MSVEEDDKNLAVLAYRLGAIETQVREGFHNIELRMAQSLLSREVYDIKHEETTKRLNALEFANTTRRNDRMIILVATGGWLVSLTIGILSLILH
jgi:hypothetical protein